MKISEPLPEFYNDLELSLSNAWSVIEAGMANRTSAAHTPVVATVDANGLPQMRIMVLREANRQSGRLRFHTDARSNKVSEICRGCAANVLFYNPEEKSQIRLSGTVCVETIGETSDAAWRQSTPFARRCYMAEAAPGTINSHPTSGLPDWIEGKQPVEADLTDARANFAVLWFKVQTLEFLYLANAGHRRAKWDWDRAAGLWSGRWLIP